MSNAKLEEVFFLGPEDEVEKKPPQVSAQNELLSDLHGLAHLIANISESYTAAIFLVESIIDDSKSDRTLQLTGFHTLSREFVADAKISFGSGLVGWAAERASRISVSPFEHNATSLKYYTRDQSLKSFVAYPILCDEGNLLGVIACDSKKSYAFSQVTEKLLLDCSEQAAKLISLHRRLEAEKLTPQAESNLLVDTLEQIRNIGSEQELMQFAANLPDDVIHRDALVVVTAEDAGLGGEVFSGPNAPSSHRLLTMVCEQKKVICSERSVLAKPTDDIKQRSFLSIPFHTLDKEAGSFNLLSKPYEAFDINEISNLETVAKVVGRELERIRLKEHCGGSLGSQGILSWKHFSALAKSRLDEAKRKRQSLSLVRMTLRNVRDFEELGGMDVALHCVQKIQRLVEQVKRDPAIACYLYGTETVVLCDSSEVEGLIRRICNLIERFSFAEMGKRPILASEELGDLILKGIQFVIAKAPRDGETISELLAHSLRLAKGANGGVDVDSKEKGQDARSWRN